MKATIFKLCIFTVIFFGITPLAFAQRNYQLDIKPFFSVLGTSTLHDWEMISNYEKGTANFTVTDSKLTEINAITITLLSESIKSGKSTMDKIAYETLKTNKFKNIKYVLKSAEKVNESTWNLIGTYSIAGINKELTTQVKTSVNNGIVSMQGSNNITFEEFGMKPPTALFGTIKTGKELTIKFNINFK